MAAKTSVIPAQARRTGAVTIRPGRATKPPAAAQPRKAKAAPTRLVVPAAISRIGLGLALVLALLIGYKVVAGSSLFAVKRVEVVGNQRASEEEIVRALRPALADRSLLEVDLAAVRRAVRGRPLIRDAVVARILPGTLRVTVKERQPAALMRKESGAYVWLSADAAELGDFDLFRPARVPPLLVGLTEGDRSERAQRDNRDRLALYQQLVAELGDDSAAVEEVNLANINPPYVSFHLKDSRIVVQVGDRDYAPRLRAALEVIGAARRGDLDRLAELRVPNAPVLVEHATRISYVYSLNRIMFGFTPLRAAKKAR
jgi:cell division septal protein FtsQ